MAHGPHNREEEALRLLGYARERFAARRSGTESLNRTRPTRSVRGPSRQDIEGAPPVVPIISADWTAYGADITLDRITCGAVPDYLWCCKSKRESLAYLGLLEYGGVLHRGA